MEWDVACDLGRLLCDSTQMKPKTLMNVAVLLAGVLVNSVGYGQGRADSSHSVSNNDSLALVVGSGWITVRTQPEGAEVYDGPKFLGVSPLDSVSAQKGIHVLRMFYPSARFWGAASETDTLEVAHARESSLVVHFNASPQRRISGAPPQATERNPELFLALSRERDDRAWLGYTAGATMIVAGALSAYLKTNSDNNFNTYLANRDPNLLSKVRGLDRWAGVSLFISEISFGLVTYLLLRE